MENRRPSRQSGWQLAAKVVFDKIVALICLILLSPVLLVIAVLVRVTLGSPVFYRQQRPGRYGEPFMILKFRSMRPASDPGAELASDAERLTRFGRFLRSASLDELPELWNVLRGELSLIGPRPLLMQYLPRYSPEQARRHDVLPGITGLVAVNGRNALSWERKFELDIWYVDHWSFWLDLKILVSTLLVVVTRKGISFVGEATNVEFLGSDEPESFSKK